MKTVQRLVLLASVTASCIGCDQVTKSLAGAQLGGRSPISFLGDTLRLSYAENRGGFLSLGAELSEPLRSWLFVGVTLATVVGLAVFAVARPSSDRLQLVGLALVVAGGAGNLIDRLALGAVRDFLNVGIGSLRTGIFNVADLAITCGVVALFAASHRSREAPRPG